MKPSTSSPETRPHRPAPGRRQTPRQQRHKRLLTQARKNPRSVLRDRRCLREPFLGDFFALCHGQALEAPDTALDYARAAVALAEKTGDSCSLHRAHGIHVHALIARRRCHEAAEVLEDYRLPALACCPPCASDWHLRHADLEIESSVPRAAGPALDLSLEHLGPDATADQRARRCFLRAQIGRASRRARG